MADLKDWSLHYNGKFFWVRGYVFRKFDVKDGTPVTTSAIIRVDKDPEGLDIYTGHSYYRCDYSLHAEDQGDLSYERLLPGITRSNTIPEDVRLAAAEQRQQMEAEEHRK
ncbi:MAG: hypothetical protein ACI4ET_09120 [Bilifractor sp.]